MVCRVRVHSMEWLRFTVIIVDGFVSGKKHTTTCGYNFIHSLFPAHLCIFLRCDITTFPSAIFSSRTWPKKVLNLTHHAMIHDAYCNTIAFMVSIRIIKTLSSKCQSFSINKTHWGNAGALTFRENTPALEMVRITQGRCSAKEVSKLGTNAGKAVGRRTHSVYFSRTVFLLGLN